MPTNDGPITPLSPLDPHTTHRAMVALVHLLGALGPFDHLSVSLTYTGGAGWDAASVHTYVGRDHQAQQYRPVGELTTDPVLVMLTAMNAAALAWHTPTLFPAA